MSIEEIARLFTRTNLPESEVELAGEISAEALVPYRERALTHLAENIELPGFRKGHVPREMVLKKIGELPVLEEAVEMCLQELYPKLIEAQKLDAVGRPEVRVTKLAPGNPVALTIRATLYPEVALPSDWKRLAEKIPLEPYSGELPKADPPPSPEDEERARQYMAREKRRGKLIDALLTEITVAVPRLFIESELEKIIGQMKDDITKMGSTFEDYLKHIKKTEETIRNDFREQAKRRATLQLTLNKIANEENIVADSEAVEAELKHALEHFKDANQALLRIHVETVLRNEKVLQLLEGSKS